MADKWISLMARLALVVCFGGSAGCVGHLKVPVNERSHVSVAANPLGSEFELSYHLYEPLPGERFDRKWHATVELDTLGTVYDSEKDYVPAAQRLEAHWEYVRAEWPPTWAGVERLMMEGIRDAEEPEPSGRRIASREHDTGQRSLDSLPLAEVSTFMFARRPEW